MSEERGKKQCPCGACDTLEGHKGLYWVCEDMPDTGPEFCPHCGAKLLSGGEVKPRVDADTRRLDWLEARDDWNGVRVETEYPGHEGFGPDPYKMQAPVWVVEPRDDDDEPVPYRAETIRAALDAAITEEASDDDE